MAIVQSIAVGKARGSAGNVTFTTQKGRVIMKEKAQFVSNPNTENQKSQRKALAVAVKAWQIFGKFGKTGITQKNLYHSAYNAFVSENIENSKELAESNPTLVDADFEGFLVTKGKMTQPNVVFSLTSPEDGECNLAVSFARSAYKVGDKLCFVAFDISLRKVKIIKDSLESSHINAGKYESDFEVSVSSSSPVILYAAWVESLDGQSSSISYLRKA